MNWNVVIIATVILLAVSAIIGIALSLASKFLAVEVDTRVEDIFKLLPGLNCGGCGSAGCHQFAETLVEGSNKVEGCRPSKPEAKEAIKKYLEEHK